MDEWEAVLAGCAGEHREGRPLVDLLGELEPAHRSALGRLGLVVLRPDSLAAGHGADILADLQQRFGAVPLAVRVGNLGPAVVDALYGNRAKIPRDSLWLHHEVFASGASATVLLGAPSVPDGAAGLTEALHRDKGQTAMMAGAPDLAPAPTLRERFGRTSSFHAVVHIPDDTPSLVAEASLLLPWPAIAGAAATLAAGVGASALPPPCVETLLALEPRPGRLVFEGVLKVKLRVAASLLIRAGVHAPPVLHELWAATAAADRDLEGCAPAAQRSRFLTFAASERDVLRPAMAAHRDALSSEAAAVARSTTCLQEWRRLREATGPLALLYCSWLLSGHEPYGHDGGERLFALLADHDVPLSPSQRTLVAAGLRHDLNPTALANGEHVFPLAPDHRASP